VFAIKAAGRRAGRKNGFVLTWLAPLLGSFVILAIGLRYSGVRISPDAHPEQGHFYRSDHFSFAKVGIPAVSIGGGDDYVGRPAGWGLQQSDDYTAHRYHQPSDEYRTDFDLRGAVQLAAIVYRFGFQLANADTVPTWNAGAEFKAIRDSSRKTQ
jgi:Zn-dependent M28 family amino/carboxypeptidase